MEKDSNDVRKWYVAYTTPRAEKQVAKRLETSGIHYYLPLRNDFRRWSDRVKKVIVPAFPSYIFVYVNQSEYYSAINNPGMVRYVKFGGVPTIVNEQTIEKIKKIFELNSFPEIRDNMPGVGDKYKIPSGPLKGIEGYVVRLKGKSHFILELKELSKYVMLSSEVLI